jgi:hypothetical protein
MGNSQIKSGEIGIAIRRGIAQLKAHPSVKEILEIRPDPANRCIEVAVAIQLGLPNQWMAAGVSPNGVRAIEQAIFSFPQDFPTHAPIVKLRTDFDRSLAHINPSLPGEPVFPCLLDGDLNELIREQGLWAIVNQLVVWLEKAALEELIDPNQGWEPIRRDSLEDIIIADGDAIARQAQTYSKYLLLGFTYLKLPKRRSDDRASKKSHIYYGQIGTQPLKSKDFNPVCNEWETTPEIISGFSAALVVFPERLQSGQFPISDRYLPESVTDIASLQARVDIYGFGKNLNIALGVLETKLRTWDFNGCKLPIALILYVRRPFLLFGRDSDVELIPYVIEVGAPIMLTEGIQTPVFPAGHQDALTSKLLQRFSGEQALENRDSVLVGCGSLGAKIGIHLARSGSAPTIVIDKDFLSPHNAARHALLPRNTEFVWGISKAKALSIAIEGLSQKVKCLDKDITEVVDDPKLLKEFFPRNTWAIINTTASLTVRETLAAIEPNRLSSRIIETSLFASGAIGLLTVEGPERNPNSVDLIVETYAAIRENVQLRQAVFEQDNPVRSYSVGQGCNSNTMVISDAKISMMAASMALAIAQMRQIGLPEASGQVMLGAVTEDGLGLNWQSFNIPPVHIVPIDKAPPWTVRILDRAHQKILQDCAKHPLVETGGILIGRVFELQQAFVVTDVLPAPIDSDRSKFLFILGTSEVNTMLEEYSSSCRFSLYCVGTWHSHLSNSGSSEQDWETARQISNNQILPSVVLIRTPTDYRAIASIDAENF